MECCCQYWFWNSRPWEMSSSVLTIEGNVSKNTSYASCLSTHRVDSKALFSLYPGSLLFYNCVQKLVSFRGVPEPPEPSHGYAPDLTGFRKIRPIFLFLRPGCSEANSIGICFLVLKFTLHA